MFKKLKSFFTKRKPDNDIDREPTDLRVQIGEAVYPIMESAFRKNKLPPEGISRKDWRHIKETILWSFSALRAQRKPFNHIIKDRQKEKIKKGLMLFSNHIDNLKL